MYGFSQVLTDWTLKLQPKTIMEWGPGVSTQLMLKCAPEAHIFTVEHNDEFHAKAVADFDNHLRVTILKENVAKRNSSYATCAYGHGPFDLAFVDGRRRVECCLVAMSLLNPGGVVILHDICRENYMRPLSEIAEIIEQRSNTAVMRPKWK